MESRKRLSIAMMLLGDAFYTVAIFGGYAVLGRRVLPARQAV